MQPIFSLPGRISPDLSRSWAAVASKEYFAGDLEVDGGADLGFALNHVLKFPVTIMHVRSGASFSFRRSWRHIRGNQVGLRAVVIVLRGGAKIVRSSDVAIVGEGQAAIIDSNVPFCGVNLCDADSVHESIRIVMPPNVFTAHSTLSDSPAAPFDLDTGDGRVVMSLIELLIGADDSISRTVAVSLSDSILAGLAACVAARGEYAPRRLGISNIRLRDIQDYISRHFTDPDISCEKVAAGCSISKRYLCYLLKAENLSFSDLLWSARLPQAHDWLILPAMRERPIYEIARMAGFKSAAHFSRMFKRAYGSSPCDYRARGGVPQDQGTPRKAQALDGLKHGACEASH